MRACVANGYAFAAVYAAEGPATACAARDLDHLDRLAAAQRDGIDAVLGEFGLGHASIEPMNADGKEFGSFALAFPLDEPANAPLTRVIASLLAATLARAERSASQTRVADRLQRALLPSRLAADPTIEFDAAYRPATDETEVGGDWYDAFEIGDGRIGISIGDVAGHGLDAAVAMGEARRAIRAAAPGFHSPAELLEYVNGVLPLDEGAGMATAIVGFYDPAERTYRYASAGHPPPLFVGTDGRPHVLPGGGLPLGFASGVASQDWTTTIEPGTALVMYTDGLLEYTRDILAGERILKQTVATTGLATVPAPASVLHDAIFASVENTDDAATLVLRGRGADAPSTSLHLRWSSFPGAAALARGSLRRYLAAVGADEAIVERVLCAVGEATANAIEHGRQGGEFRIALEQFPDRFVIGIENQGPWLEFIENEERGRGLPIMQAFADGVAITTTSTATEIRLTFRREG